MKNTSTITKWVLGFAVVTGLLASAAVSAQDEGTAEAAAEEPVAATEEVVGQAEAAPEEVAADAATVEAGEPVDAPGDIGQAAVAGDEESAETGTGVIDRTADEGRRAVGATRDAVSGGGEGAKRGWGVFVDTIVGTFQRIGPMLVPLGIALIILLAFWLVGSFLGGLVTRGLRSTEWDNRLADKTGIDEVSGGEIESIAGTIVKWVILLGGFVAVFNYLDLGMVATPIENVLNQLGSAILSLGQALLVLLIAWLIASTVRFLASRGLRAVGFDTWAGRYIPERVVEGERVGASVQIGRLLFYIILVLALPLFLEALGQESLVAPLNEMFGKVFAFIPNIFAALILVFIARWVATVVRDVVVNLLAVAGLDRFAERWEFGAGSKKLSEIIGALAYFFVLVPILIAAVDALGIAAISDPVKATLEQLLSAVPLVIVAVIVLAIGYYIAKAVRQIVQGFLEGVGFDGLPEKLGLGFLKPREGHASLSAIVGAVVMGVILVLTAEQALSTLQLDELSAMLGGILGYLPSLLIGLAIIVAGLSIGAYVGRLVGDLLSSHPQGKLVSLIANYFIVFLTFSMGLTQMGVGEEVVQVAVSAVLGGVALALALAFGIGGQDKAREFLSRRFPKE